MEKQLLDHLKRSPKQHLAFNPGTLQLRRGLKSLKPVIARSDFFVVNKEEAARLLEDGERPIKNMLMSFHHLGAKIVAITDGPRGSYATDGKETWYCPIFPGPIVERTGAGDSYTIGFVYGLFHRFHLPECMRIGSANAWSVVQKIGPQAGLLTQAKLFRVLKKFNKIHPKRENHES
jgi:sugar/nucleoside kinase (ribokinase family)